VGAILAAVWVAPPASPTTVVVAWGLLLRVTRADPYLAVSGWNWRRLLVAAAVAARLSVDEGRAEAVAAATRSGVVGGRPDLHRCVRALLVAARGSFAVGVVDVRRLEGWLVGVHALLARRGMVRSEALGVEAVGGERLGGGAAAPRR